MKIKKIIVTILIVVCVFFAVVLCKNYFSYKIPNSSMGVRAAISNGKTDTLFIGSSAYRKGIDMARVVSELDKDSFMLTYNGNEPFNMYVELKEILAENQDIERIVFDFNPSMADRGADLSDKRLLWDISMSGKIELWNEIKKEADTGFFDFYDYWVLSNNDYMLSYPISYPMISKRYSYGGGSANDETPAKTKEELDAMEIIENPGVNSLQKRSYEEIVRLCSEKGIEVIFLECPRYVTMENNICYQNKLQEMTEIIENISDVNTNVRIITAVELGMDNSNSDFYSDLTHMSAKGKQEYTSRIIELLRD